MPKKLNVFRKKAGANHRRRLHRIKKVSKQPFFAVPVLTFLILGVVTVGLLLFVTKGEGRLQSLDTNIAVVSYDDQEQTVPTRAKTVGELLKKMDITLHEGDVVEPSPDTGIASDNFRVNVYRAVPVTIVDGSKKSFVYSAAATPRSIVKQAGVAVYPEDNLSLLPTENFLAESSLGERVVIKRATPVQFNLYGTPATIRTHAKTVGDLLAERKVALGADDEILPDVSTELTPETQVFIVRKGTQIQTIEEAVAAPVENVNDPSLASGTIAVRQQGAPGKKLVTYQINLQNGQEVGRSKIQEVVTQEPVKRIVAQGSRPLTDSLQTWLYKLRQCESGGNYRTNTGNGFYGAYQFMISTWDRIAKRVRPDLVGVRPDLASPADQDYMIITNTNLSKGGLASQNPGCYKKEGLSQFPPANH